MNTFTQRAKMAATYTTNAMDHVDCLISETAARLGYPKLRERQKEAVLHFVKGNDVFVCLPTGSGKTLCYTLLPGLFDRLLKVDCGKSMVIVVSPLQALMKEQVSACTEKGLNAVVASDQCAQDLVLSGNVQLLYISPETLLTNREWRDVLESPLVQENLVALVVDEAHCVKKWLVSLSLKCISQFVIFCLTA